MANDCSRGAGGLNRPLAPQDSPQVVAWARAEGFCVRAMAIGLPLPTSNQGFVGESSSQAAESAAVAGVRLTRQLRLSIGLFPGGNLKMRGRGPWPRLVAHRAWTNLACCCLHRLEAASGAGWRTKQPLGLQGGSPPSAGKALPQGTSADDPP